MTHAPAPSRPFAFDTEFDSSGAVVHSTNWQPVKRAYLPAEVEALVAEARSEGHAQALAEVDSRRSQAIADLSAALAASLPRLTGVVETYREQTADLALAFRGAGPPAPRRSAGRARGTGP